MTQTLWSSAYGCLPGADPARATQVKDAVSFADAAFELDISLQISWKATPEAVLADLEARHAPQFYIDHRRTNKSLIVSCEDEAGKRSRRVPERGSSTSAVVGTVAKLVHRVALSLVPLNDGDDLHFVMVPPETVTKLKRILGDKFREALEPVLAT